MPLVLPARLAHRLVALAAACTSLSCGGSEISSLSPAGPSALPNLVVSVRGSSAVLVNSEIPLGVGSPQLQWVRDQLSTNPYRCALVYWHRPLFSSGRNGPNPDMLELWRVLFSMDVDVVLNGHDHLYERFAPQTPEGRRDPIKGIRQFTVGTGGAPRYEIMRTAANSEVTASVWGVASFTLQDAGYSWAFVPVEGEAFRDAGAGVCH